ncbi:MAG: CPBP family intramembrane metalloprotease [Chloroflexota bacterium]|nr:CPBP family intramembrane metalloprotease [Chloroflexota bacterium]
MDDAPPVTARAIRFAAPRLLRWWDSTVLRTGLLLAGLAVAVGLRVVLAGPTLARAVASAMLFAVALLTLAVMSGWRPSRPSRATIAAGIAGGLVLLVLPVLTHAGGPYLRLGQAAPLPLWVAVTVLVATAEEALLRGALFAASPSRTLLVPAVLSTVAFALLHVPLYGWHVVPLDLAVGLWLSGLRIVTGGATAPAVAHVVADLGTWGA